MRYLGVSLHITVREKAGTTYSIPISPFLLSALPLPQMISLEEHPSKQPEEHGMTYPASYRHNTQSKGGVFIGQRSRTQREPRLRIKVGSMVLVSGRNCQWYRTVGERTLVGG